jgi:cytochrome bd-type quinol oxidase subunit 2
MSWTAASRALVLLAVALDLLAALALLAASRGPARARAHWIVEPWLVLIASCLLLSGVLAAESWRRERRSAAIAYGVFGLAIVALPVLSRLYPAVAARLARSVLTWLGVL